MDDFSTSAFDLEFFQSVVDDLGDSAFFRINGVDQNFASHAVFFLYCFQACTGIRGIVDHMICSDMQLSRLSQINS
jgi:hypothetical protein